MTPLLATRPAPNALAADLARLEVLFHSGEMQRCRELAEAILVVDRESAFAWKVLAASTAALDGAEAALPVYEEAALLLAGDWQFHNNHANALKLLGRYAEAEERYHTAIALLPAEGCLPVEPFYNLGVTLLEAGDMVAAEQALRQVLQIDARHGLAHLNLANILNALDRRAEAEAHYLDAFTALPDDPRLLNNYGQLLGKMHRFAEAEAMYRRAIALDEHFAHPCVNLAELMAGHGLIAHAEVLLRHALLLDAALAKAHSNLLFTMALREGVGAEELFVEHRRFAAQFEAPLKAEWAAHENSRDEERVLRVGFVSGDFRDHPVERYLPHALQGLRLGGGFELLAYSTGIKQDAVTEHYRSLFAEWHDVAMMPEAALATKVRSDAVDILIDLSGHSGDNRMLTFARKPAPVQMSWMGYVGTSGLDAMDYFIGDEHLPPRGMEWQFTEKILRLPAATTFASVQERPIPNALPALERGYLTFCSLARINKLNASVVRLWARVLHAVPVSRMLLLALPDGTPPAMVLEWFADAGVGADRLVFAHARSVRDILLLHHEVDVALDTLPYNGSTAIQHALTMGVPTLTMRGQVPGGWMGASIAGHVGIPQFIVQDEKDLVQRAVEISGDLAALAELRRTLPARFAASALCDHAAAADALAAGLREAWRRWCRRLPPALL